MNKKIFWAFVLACSVLGGCADSQHRATPLTLDASKQSAWSVMDFGAIGDGRTDDTAAFQAALDAAAKAGGGTVSAPRGNYLFLGRLSIPQAVTLQGISPSAPSHTGLRDAGKSKPGDDGTTFLVTGDADHESAPAFLTLSANSGLRGVVIYYPRQTQTDVPTPYPYAVALRGDNAAVVDCELLNPYNGIDTSGAGRFLIRDVQGQPLRRGIYVDEMYDIGRIEDVHFNPWYSMSPKLLQWQMDNGEAFIFGRADWIYVLNTFCFGYHVGYHFISTPHGVCNGNFLGIGADDSQTDVMVEEASNFGVLITNGEFVSFHGPDPTMVRINSTNHGIVRFLNCAYWGGCNQIAIVDGTGSVSFSSCTFAEWAGPAKDRAAIQVHSGSVIVQDCIFREADLTQVQIDEGVAAAIIKGNLVAKSLRIQSKCKNAVVSDNVAN